MFTFEEVTKDIRMNLVIPTLICVFAGCTVSMTILGMQPDYNVINRTFIIPGVKESVAFILFGIFIGVMGPLYNKMVLILLNTNAYFKKVIPEVKAGIIGIVVALLVYFAPGLAGGGDQLGTEMLNYTFPIATVLVIGLIRWFLRLFATPQAFRRSVLTASSDGRDLRSRFCMDVESHRI